MATTTSKSGFSEYLHFCRSLQEYQQLKLLEKVERLFLQISKIDDQFRITFQDKMKTIDHLDRRQVLDDYSNKVPINEILLGHPKFDNRTFTQVFAEKFKTDKLKVFHDFDVFSFLKSCEISCWTLFRTSELIKDQPNPTVASICDILTGMAMLPSQMVVVLALIIVFISEWKLLVDNLDKLRQLEALFQNLAPENNLIFNLEHLFENILNLEDETGNPDKETVEMVDELTKYLKALDDEKKDFTENLNIAMKRVESELPQPDIIIEKVVQGNNKHVEKTNMEANSLQNLVEGLKKQSWEIADGTVLFNKIMNVQNGIDVYVQVIHNGDTNILLGTIKDIRKDPRGMKKETFYIHIKDRTLIRISEVQVERSKLGFANSWTTMIYPRGTRVMAIFYPRTRDEEIEYKKGEKLSQWLPGIIGGFDRKYKEYLVFFDIDIDAYIDMNKVRLHFDQTIIEKENGELIVEVRENYKKVNDKGRSEFLKKYLCDKQAPQIHDGRIGESLRAKDSRRTYKATIIKIERLLYLLRFPKNDRISYNDQGLNCSEFNCTKHNHSDKWIYRGSTTRLDIQEMNVKLERRKRHVQQQEMMRKIDDDEKFTRQIARKSTNNFQTNLSGSTTTIISDGNIKNRKMKSTKVERKSLKSPNWSKILIWNNHEKCSKKCLELNQKTIQEHVKNLNYPKIVSPFFKPILNGWTRIIVNSTTMKSKRSMSVKRDRKDYVNYISPCGTRFYDITDIDNYLKETNSPLPIMWFTMFSCVDPETVIEVPKQFLIDPDFSLGMEGVPIPVVNAIDRQPKPKMIYNSTRFARNEKVNQVLENSRQARSCCSCIDDCSNVEQCECQQLTIKEHSRLNPQLQGTIKNYDHGSLHQRIQSAVYECNSKCLCNKDKCCNYISQRKIEIPIQLFQTAQSGWGVRTLVDIPTGMFVSTYAGEILTDEMADKIAEEYGNGRDMYYADLDFLESMENEKINRGFDLPDDGIEEDLPTNDSANLTKYFKNESLFLVDAFNEGNIGRFYNHSCDPNLFVQNIFTDTHDMRFPVMAFFSLKDVAAGAELTWDYNYIVTDSTVKCHCGSSNCRGFLM